MTTTRTNMSAHKKKVSHKTPSTAVADIDAKISDKRLKSFATGKSSRRRTVLIRLNVPGPKLTIGKRRRIGKTSLPRRSLAMSESQQKERKRKAAQVMRSLNASGIESNRLNSGTIVAKVYPEQLREIAQFDLIKTIVPNRKYKVV